MSIKRLRVVSRDHDTHQYLPPLPFSRFIIMSYHDDKALYSNKASLEASISNNFQEWARFQKLLNIAAVSEQDKSRYAARCNQLREQIKQDQATLYQVEMMIRRNEEERRNDIARQEQMEQARKAETENMRALQLYFNGLNAKKEVDKQRNRPH